MKNLKKILFLITNRERKLAYLLIVMILIMSLLEMIGVASIFPFMSVLADPNIIETNIDIIHIDIANNGDVFEYAIKNYLPKLCENGILLLEGGSIERDKVEWMSKYNKPLIEPVIKKHIKNNLNIQVIGSFPSITIIRK